MPDGVHVRVGLERYVFDVADVREVEERGEVTPVPGAPAAVAGVRSLRGAVLPVIELAAVLGSEDAEPGRYIVVAESGDHRAGLAVHQIIGVEPLPADLQAVEDGALIGRALLDEELVGVLDARRILLSIAGG